MHTQCCCYQASCPSEFTEFTALTISRKRATTRLRICKTCRNCDGCCCSTRLVAPTKQFLEREKSRVGQNHICTVYIRYFWQGFYQIYGHIRCIYTVLANPTKKAHRCLWHVAIHAAMYGVGVRPWPTLHVRPNVLCNSTAPDTHTHHHAYIYIYTRNDFSVAIHNGASMRSWPTSLPLTTPFLSFHTLLASIRLYFIPCLFLCTVATVGQNRIYSP